MTRVAQIAPFNQVIEAGPALITLRKDFVCRRFLIVAVCGTSSSSPADKTSHDYSKISHSICEIAHMRRYVSVGDETAV
jgi:hypothetical protein